MPQLNLILIRLELENFSLDFKIFVIGIYLEFGTWSLEFLKNIQNGLLLTKKEGSKKMKDRTELLAYCGFYCGDCLGHTGVIADASKDFKKVLDKYQFDRTAKCILPDQLKDYDRFYEIVEFMTGLKCPMTCREREDSNVACEVRKCCLDNGYYACHECNNFETCEKLKSLMHGLHYDASIKNLKAIRAMGLEGWIAKGIKYHYWDETDK